MWSTILMNMYITFLDLHNRSEWLQLSNAVVWNMNNINNYLKNNFTNCTYITWNQIDCMWIQWNDKKFYHFTIEKDKFNQNLYLSYSGTKINLIYYPYEIVSRFDNMNLEFEQYSDSVNVLKAWLINWHNYKITFPYN